MSGRTELVLQSPGSQADSASSNLVSRSLENPYGIRDSGPFRSGRKISGLAHVGRYGPLLTVL